MNGQQYTVPVPYSTVVLAVAVTEELQTSGSSYYCIS